MEKKTFLRQVAFRIRIKDLLDSPFIEEKDGEQSFNLYREKKIFRIDITGIVIQKEILGTVLNLLIDDSTSPITVRLFEENKGIISLKPGDFVNVIGKLRKYNNESYIYPEIIKKRDMFWFKLRLKELEKVSESKNFPEEKKEATDDVKENLENESRFKDSLQVEKIINLIKKLDNGLGVPIEEIIEKSSLENTEKIINAMLKKGDIFNNQPGKVKIL